MPLAPELKAMFAGKRMCIESGGGGYYRFVPKPGDSDDRPWADLDPAEHGNVQVRLLRHLGVDRACWESAAPETRALVIRACEVLDSAEGAIQAALGLDPLKGENLAEIARVQALTPLVEWFERIASQPSSLQRADARCWSHSLARLARPHLVRILRDSKREAKSSRPQLFQDVGWQQRIARIVNALLASYLLPQKCAPAALARLRDEQPTEAAIGILSVTTGLSEDDLRRAKPRVGRGLTPDT